MKHLLITGFDPFGGGSVNPSWEAVSRLPDEIGGWRLTKLRIPTIFAAAGLPGKISNTAGTYVCNDTLYRLLHHYAGTATRVGFIHVPLLPHQAENGEPSMELAAVIAALTAAIGTLG